MLITDPKQLNPLIAELNLQLNFDFGISSDGYIVYLRTLIEGSDKNDKFALGVENTIAFEHFNAPKFTLDPKSAGTIDYMKVFNNWKELLPNESEENALEDLEPIVIPNGDPII
jgi:hypothetical protein